MNDRSDFDKRLPLNRRQAIGAIAGGVAAASMTSPVDAADQSSLVVDSHLHCFAGPEDARFPYHERAPYRPGQPATPEFLLERMDGAGVDHAIVVHPEPYQDDHRYLEHCIDIGNGRLKGTCLFFSDQPKSLERLPQFLRQHEDHIVATRLHAYAPGRLPPWGSPELDRLWAIATDAGVAMQVHLEPRYAARLDPYLRRYKETRVIIDHLGRPMQGTPEEHAVVLGWSELPNTVMKLAAIPPQDKYPHRDVAPVIARLAELWGAERLIYGGGFNANTTDASYREYRQKIAAMLPNFSDEDRKKVLGGNAAKLFGFDA
ncbi:Amidohydrolase [Roseimaritima multifibrata]|uniref:Amidohydrolase n=1 Tax=Roseimaritima multifibrata TaxID=1930274 RepID=A0A517MGF1_9BACT|nr:amidohydrolase family protein [Roseimaritima multifibrata]QDS93962.1 Amidohydrolase [Roseimaritima multifibrata]